MAKTRLLVYIIIVLLIMENVALWYVADFYYQYQAHERRADSKKGQAEVCKTVPIHSGLFSALEKMHGYYPIVDIDSRGRINLSYGSEAKGFVTSAVVAFIFDKDYQLTHKDCGAKWEPEPPMY